MLEPNKFSGVRTTVDLVCSYVAHNAVPAGSIPVLINTVHGVLKSLLDQSTVTKKPNLPAVSVRKSITNDHLVCMEDGKSFRSLKRHLRAAFDMCPQQYRAKWNLPATYPMTAPGYSAARSTLARSLGLGTRDKKALPGKSASTAPKPVDAKPAKRARGRPAKKRSE